MNGAVYNSAIPGTVFKSAVRTKNVSYARLSVFLLLAVLAAAIGAHAADWSAPEQNFSRRIVKVTGTAGAVALTFDNRSSLGRRDSEIVENGLLSTLSNLGLRFTRGDATPAPATVKITLSENLNSYVWVAEIHMPAGEVSVVVESVPQPESAATHESVPIRLRTTLLWRQDDPILDVAVLEENSSSTRFAVLGAEKVSLYRAQNGNPQLEQTLNVQHTQPWPRDLRGHLVIRSDHAIDVYLPGVFCTGSANMPIPLNCRDSDDPWPLLSGASGLSIGSEPKAFFAKARNYFTGVLTPALGKFANVPSFYSAAIIPYEQHAIWIFAATDRRVYFIDDHNQETKSLDWGSDLTSVKTSCGAGWQVLATSSGGGESGDSIRAYEFPDGEAVAVSAAMDFSGPVTALWAEARGVTAIAVVKDEPTGRYEALRVALACGQ